MERYVDIDKLIAEYDRVHIGPAGGARKLMVEAPIADVVPRAMIAEIFEEIDKIRTIENCVYKRGLGGCFNFDIEYSELKKKYTKEALE